MATNSKKSNKSKYLKLGTLTVVIAAGVTVPIVMISRVDASDKAKPQIKPEVKPKDAYKGFIGTYNEEGNDPVHRPYNGNASNGDSPTVAMITDGGNPHDGAFNESAIWGAKTYSGRSGSGKTYKVYEVPNKGVNKQDFIDQYEIPHPGLSYVVSGYRHAFTGNVKEWWSSRTNPKPVVAIDIADTTNDEFYGITFKTEQSGFLAAIDAGYILNKNFKDETKTDPIKVATFGGLQASSVTPYMNGFANGIKWWNDNKSTINIDSLPMAVRGLELVHIDDDPSKDFSNSFDVGVAKPLVKKFMDKGAKAIMAVAGEETKDIVDVINERGAQGGVFAIGVDADQSRVYGGSVITSAIKGMEVATNSILVDIENNNSPADKIYTVSDNPPLGFGEQIIGSAPNGKYLTSSNDSSNLGTIKRTIIAGMNNGTIDASINPIWTPIDI